MERVANVVMVVENRRVTLLMRSVCPIFGKAFHRLKLPVGILSRLSEFVTYGSVWSPAVKNRK